MASETKSPALSKKERRQKVWNALPEIWALIRPRRGLLALGFVLMAVNRICGLVLPASTKYFIDNVIGKRQTELLTPIVLGVLAATLVQGLTSFTLTQLLSKSAQKMIAELRRQVQAHIGRLPISFYDANKTGALVSRIMSDVEGVRNLIGTGLVEFVGGLMTAVIALGYLLHTSVTMTLLAFGILLVFGVGINWAFKTIRPIFRARPKINAEVTGRFGGHKIIAGSMSLGQFFAFNIFLGLLIAPVFQIVAIGTQITEAITGLERTREILNEAQEDADPRRTVALERISGYVAMESVSFAYDTRKEVLHEVSFASEPGTVTALVGPSGAGKSTIIGLIAAFYVPTSGRVLVDGVDLSTVKLDSYRRQLGVVLQETFLFDGTIRENVAFARPEAGEEEIMAACRIARVDEFAEGFEKKYDTVVGERGVKLSGGQKQRVSIARAILADPRILILDEATSSLDSESEALIQEGLRYLMRGRTTFVIAHRLSTIRRAEQILVVEAGRIIERGTHESLYAQGGRYFDLYTKQHAVETNLFLAPGEGDSVQGDTNGAEVQSGRGDGTVPDAIRIIRGQNN